MKHIIPFYYCGQCKKVMPDLKDVVFVEQIHYYSFCSEKCIVDFFSPLVTSFELQLKEWRAELKIDSESIPLLASDHHRLVEKALKNPDEVWIVGGENLTEELHVLITQNPGPFKCHLVLVTLLFEGNPSFVVLETVTQNSELLNLFRHGRRVTRIQPRFHIGESSEETVKGERGEIGDIGEENESQEAMAEQLENNGDAENSSEGDHVLDELMDIPVDGDTLRYVETKKAELLNKYLEERSIDDISMEDFPLYEEYMSDTLGHPDEVYLETSSSGDEVFTYIKGFQRKDVAFYYIVVSIHYQGSSSGHDGEQTLIPVLAFPTKDPEVHRKYKKGKQIEGHSLI